jgi:acetyl esterase/lipase
LRRLSLLVSSVVFFAGAAFSRPPDTTFTYARVDSLELKLDLYFPADTLRRPVPLIVWIHGGGWRGGSRTDSALALLWRDSGFAVASVDYRLSKQARWPAQIHDVKAAVRWLRANADTLELDTGRVVAWGESAGAHLASFLGVTGPADTLEGNVSLVRYGGVRVDSLGNRLFDTASSAPAPGSHVHAVVDYYGGTDFLEYIPRRWTPWSSVGELIGCGVAKCKDRARGASPVYYASAGDAPFLIVHGTADSLVPVSQSIRFDSALRAAGVPVAFFTVPDGHGGPLFTAPETFGRVRAFLDSTLAPAPVPPVLPPAAAPGTAKRGFWRRWF